MMTSNEIREKFLSFFESKGHTRVSSASLVPHDDPTLLFTNAGMNQFKDIFLGVKKPSFTRATTSQKCVRAGGKHNDLDSVGRTARHHTFFEMLGNFSFGDYFKKEAITYAWEFLTDVLKLPKDKLWISVFENDEEAYNLWQEIADIPANRIVRLGEEDNFWSMGDTGPCGPCSEIYIDRGEEHSCDAPECALGKCDCDRWRELWNLVFMQFDRDEKGNLNPLPKPSIDTGMGLERIATVMQNIYSNYDTDLLRPIIGFVEDMTGKKYFDGDEGFPFRVIADHSRAITFLISDGVLPGNEGRSYVLRRILRRAARYGKELDLNEPFLYKIVPKVAELMGETYPEIKRNLVYIQKVVKAEEERFNETLHDGLKILDDGIKKLETQKEDMIPGSMAFMLYDTYGFPIDLTCDIAQEKGMKVDTKTFDELMEQQRAQAKAARKDSYKVNKLLDILSPLPATEFLGYDDLESKGQVKLIIAGSSPVEKSDDKSEELILVLDKTPFYGEAGGQIGDIGKIENDGFTFEVSKTQKTDGKIYHVGRIIKGSIKVGDSVLAKVNAKVRKSIARNHTATHLLHKALKEVLGEHVNQSGSLVEEQRLRFDFSHFSSLTSEELQRVESKVNDAILCNLPVTVSESTLEQAQKEGAVALFGEKYKDEVRIVSIGDYSKELCGGTHLKSSAEIGLFKIISETSVGAGIRRIEAVTGYNLIQYLYDTLDILKDAACHLKTSPQEVPEKASELVEQLKMKEREIESLRDKAINTGIDDLLKKASSVEGVDFISAKVGAKDIEELRKISDAVREKLKSGVVVLGSVVGEKVMFIAAVSEDLIKKGYHAGKIVKAVSALAQGGGGGRPDFAQAGGKAPEKLDEALEAVEHILKDV